MKSTTAITIVALAVGLASAAAQNRPAATPAAASSASANSSATAQAVQNALSLGQNGSALATQIRNDGLNICDKKADKKKCAPASP